MSAGRLLLLGHRGGTHVGESLWQAAGTLGLEVEFVDADAAWNGPWWLRQWHWRMRGHRPARLQAFSAALEARVLASGHRRLLCTGPAPLTAGSLRRLREAGVRCLNFSTDDPFNPVHRATWHLEALREYSVVCTPRSRNLEDLRALGCRHVAQVWFGYDPRHCSGEAPTPAEAAAAARQVLLVGGADADRRPFAEALLRAGVDVALYGGYWDRWPLTAPHARGLTDPQQLRRQTAASAISVGLVRRANRDGHVMRSFEIGASGGCMVAEDTPEHRALFGPEDACVRYFGTPEELAATCTELLRDAPARARLRTALHGHIVRGHHTYVDRLRQMLELLDA